MLLRLLRRNKPAQTVPDKCYLVVGLGNIGAEYAATRHNIGFMILDAWAQASNVVFEPGRYGDMAVVRDKGREFYLLKPSTYMNLSGNAVRYWLQKLGLPPERRRRIVPKGRLMSSQMTISRSGGRPSFCSQ